MSRAFAVVALSSALVASAAAQSPWWTRVPATADELDDIAVIGRASEPSSRLRRAGSWHGQCAGYLDVRQAVALVPVTRYMPVHLAVRANERVFVVVRAPSGHFHCVSAGEGLDLREVGEHAVWIGTRARGDAHAMLRLIPMNVAVP